MHNRIGWRRRENIADRNSISQSLAHIAHKAWLVTGTTANDQPHLAGARTISRDQCPVGAANRLHEFAMGPNNTVEHFLNHFVWIVEELLHPHAKSCRNLIGLGLLRKTRIKINHTIGAQNTESCRSIGHKHIDETAAERCQKCWHLVETACNRNTGMNLPQLIERNADCPLIKRTCNRLPTLIDETACHNTDSARCKILLQRNRFKKAAGVNGGIGTKRRHTEENAIGILKGRKLFLKQRLFEQHIPRLLRTHHSGCHDIHAACRNSFCKCCRTTFGRIGK